MTAALLDVLVRQMLATIELDVDPIEESEATRLDVHGSIALHGKPRQRLHAGLTLATAERLAELVTGLTPALLRQDPTLFQDLANEIVNIMAGNLWPSLEGATGIGLPVSGPPPDDARARTWRRYTLDGTVGIVVSLDVLDDAHA
jgi:hypothetical protein